MKNVLGITAVLLIGLVTGYFGVFGSVFSDGSILERVITISILLFIYFIIGILIGFLLQKIWKFGFLFSWEAYIFLQDIQSMSLIFFI
jgi:VIT1/CCC1 family predicted Fe2+/Mn2+ transporter